MQETVRHMLLKWDKRLLKGDCSCLLRGPHRFPHSQNAAQTPVPCLQSNSSEPRRAHLLADVFAAAFAAAGAVLTAGAAEAAC